MQSVTLEGGKKEGRLYSSILATLSLSCLSTYLFTCHSIRNILFFHNMPLFRKNRDATGTHSATTTTPAHNTTAHNDRRGDEPIVDSKHPLKADLLVGPLSLCLSLFDITPSPSSSHVTLADFIDRPPLSGCLWRVPRWAAMLDDR